MSVLSSLRRQFIIPSAASIAITAVVALGALVAKFAGLAKELMVAYKLGAGLQLDAFLYAYSFLAFLIAVFTGGLAASFIPRYLAVEAAKSASEARQLAGELATIIAVATIALVTISIPAMSFLIPRLAGGFDSETKALAVRLVPLLSPLLIFSVFTTLWSNLLNAHRRFSAAAFIPLITPLVVLGCVYGHVGSSGGVALAIGTTAGGLIEVSILAVFTRSAGLRLFHVPRRWRPEYAQVLGQFLPGAGASVLMAATLIIDQSFAANLAAGSVSILSYGTKIAAVIASVLVVIVSTLSLPMFSRLSAEGSYHQLRRAFFTASSLTLCFTIPVAAVLALGAEPILELLFVRGQFTSNDAAMAASVQAVHAWHLVPYILSIVAVRALAAIAETWILLVGSLANLLVDLLVNAFMVPKLGVVAIGLASTAMYLTSAALLACGFVFKVQALIRRSH